ncbi:mechanosensitive ion channel family protein [Paenibacillus sp. 1P07SE]|uniref:mechanosensitive ion channel family protein n=1 Tax=Paenibacillus sp. 1P07SE TaxID=3132209 RepID=UPI0039A63BCE
MKYIQDWFEGMGVESYTAIYLTHAVLIAAISLLSILANYLAKKVVLRIITFYVHNNRYQWDNYMLDRKVFHKLSHIAPALIIYFSAPMFPSYQTAIVKGVAFYLIIVALMVLSAFLNAINDIYVTFEISKQRPIRGYLQVVKIFIFIVGGILLISSLIGQSPLILLSGVGALSAVIMLIFKDSILGLVAGVQLTSNDMVRVGDWIEMPKYGADGDVLDISLNTVKVQNWDMTITTIPTYALISDSFKNWRGMQSSGGRRIKRSIYLDMNSIVICDPELLERLRKIQYLRDHIAMKEAEIETYHQTHAIDRTSRVNGRALTNVGLFRTYIQQYLKHHPMIHQDMLCIVRQLQPEESGLPMEIYAFTNDIRWVAYESAQADIFDHLLAIAPEFGLRVFQNPSGHDMKQLLQQPQPQNEPA